MKLQQVLEYRWTYSASCILVASLNYTQHSSNTIQGISTDYQ